MQRFHTGSCTSAVNNSALSGIQARDTSRAESSSLPSNFPVNSRRSSQLTAYKLKCDKEQLNARLGPPDLHPQTPNCPEETLTREYAQSGYRETVEGLEEAREISLSQIQAFTKPIIVKCKEAIRKCHRAINDSRAQKRKAGQVYGVPLSGTLLNKPGIFPEQRPCGEDFRKKWIEGLSQPHKRLRSLADHVPHGYRRKSLFEVLIRDNVPLLKATWFIKVTYLNQIRATSSNSSSGFHDKSQFSRSEQWTKDAIEYLQYILDDFMSRNHAHSALHILDRSTQINFAGPLQPKGNSSSATMDVDEPSLYTKWWYVVRIVHWHHAEGLLVPSLIIDWVLNQLQEKDLLSVLQLLLPIIYGFVETVVSSQTYVRTLVGIAFRFIREPSPGGSDLVENSRHAYTTSAVVEMLRYLILAVPDTFVALDCFPLPMCVVSTIVNDGNFLSKMVEDTKKLKYGHVEVAGVLRDRKYGVQEELLSFQSVVSSIEKRAETLSRASKPDHTAHNMARAVQTLDNALMSGDIGVSYNLLFESCWDGLCAERWSADVSPCLRASLKHVRRVTSSLMCSVFFICEWATCEYRDFRTEPPHGLKFTGQKDVSQIFIAIRLLKLKMINLPNFCSHDQKIRDTSDVFESPGPLHDAIVCWIDQHEVHNGEGFKRLQLLVGELIRSGIFSPLAYGRQLIVSGMMDGNGAMVNLEKQRRHYKLLKHLPASYIRDVLEESQIAEPSILMEVTNTYSNERRLVLHGPMGQNKSTAGAKRQKHHHKSGTGIDSPSSVDQWYFQATSHLSTGDVDADKKLDDVKAAVSIILQFPLLQTYTMDSGVDESLGYTNRPGGWYNRIGGNEDTSVCEECRRIKRQKLTEEKRPTVPSNTVDDDMWWVRKEMKYIDSSRAEPPPKLLKQTPRGRQKSGRKTQSLAQLAAARIEGSQGASTSHVCEGRLACPHHRTGSDDSTKLAYSTGKTPLGDIVSVGKLLKPMRLVEKRRLMVWLVSVVKQLIEESEKTAAKIIPYGRSAPAGDDRNSRHWRLGEDELSAILYLMDVCNEFVSAARFLLWLLPRVPGNPPIFGRSPVMFSRTADNNLCEVGEAFLLSSIRSYENIMVAADLIPELLSSAMRRVGTLLAAKSRLSGSTVLAYARQLLKKYSNTASVLEWEKTFKATCDKRLISELESSRSLEGDFGFNLGVPNGVEDLDDYFRQKINSVRVSRVGMSMKEIVHRHVDEAFQYFYNKDRKAHALANKNSTTEKWVDGYQVALQIVTGLMECMRNTGGAAQEGDPSLVSSAVAAIINNVGLVIARIPDLPAGTNHLNATSPSLSLHFARRILRIHTTCLCILKDALGERQSRVFEVALAIEASSTLLQTFAPGKAPRSQFQMSPESHDVNANMPNENSNHSNKTVMGRSARIMASVSALVIGCILQGVASLERMVALFRLKEGLDLVQFVRSLKTNVNGNARSMGSLKVENLLEVSLNWFRVLVGNCRTVSDGLIVDLLGEASIVALSRMQRSLTLNLVFQPAYSLFAFLTWKPILDATFGVREDFHRVYQLLAFAIGDAIKHIPFREICFRDTRGLYDLMSANTLDYDFVSLLESIGSDSNLKAGALVPLRSRLFLDALIDCKVPEPVVKLDGSTWITGHGELKRQCGENVKRLMGKLVHVLDTLQPAKFHWQWVEIRLLLHEQAVNEKMMENDASLADAIRSFSPYADKSSASENESNFVQIILTRVLVRPDAASLFSEAVRLLGKSLEDSMLSQAKWLLRGGEVLYGKKSIRQKIINIASDLKELSYKSQYWKPWGWCNAPVSPLIIKGGKRKSEAGILEEGELVDESNDFVGKGNGLLDVEGFIVSQQHLTERALIELILPCVDQGSDDLRNNFANEMIKQMSNIEQQINAVTRGVCKLPATASPAIGSPANKSGTRKSGKGGSPIISRQLTGSTDSVPPSPAALRASMTLRLQFLLRLLPIICSDREPSTRNMRYALASVIIRLLGSRVVYEDSCHFVNTAVISSKRNAESLMEASNASALLCGESLFDSLLSVLHVLLSSHQPSWLKGKHESKSTEYNRDYVVFEREVAESMQNELDHMELPEVIRWRIQTAMPIILPSSRFSLSCQPPSLPPAALACLQPSNPVTSLNPSTPQKNQVLPGRAAPSLKTKPQMMMQQDLDADIDRWTLLEDGAGSCQPSSNSAIIESSDHANLKAIHWLKGAVRVRRTDLTYVGTVDEDS